LIRFEPEHGIQPERNARLGFGTARRKARKEVPKAARRREIDAVLARPLYRWAGPHRK